MGHTPGVHKGTFPSGPSPPLRRRVSHAPDAAYGEPESAGPATTKAPRVTKEKTIVKPPTSPSEPPSRPAAKKTAFEVVSCSIPADSGRVIPDKDISVRPLFHEQKIKKKRTKKSKRAKNEEKIGDIMKGDPAGLWLRHCPTSFETLVSLAGSSTPLLLSSPSEETMTG